MKNNGADLETVNNLTSILIIFLKDRPESLIEKTTALKSAAHMIDESILSTSSAMNLKKIFESIGKG